MVRWKKWGLLAGALCGAQPASAEWVEASSDHFLVYGDLKPAEASEFAEQLERVDKLLRAVTNTPDSAAERANKVTVYFVSDLGTVERLAGRDDVAGFYKPGAQGALAVTPRSMGTVSEYMRPQQVLFHEYFHAILLGGAKVAYPLWVSEGLAEFFGTVEPRPDGSLLLGGLPQSRGFALAEQNQMSAEELLTADKRRLGGTDQDHLYARGWAMVHMLMLNKARAGQLDTYMRLIGDGAPSLDAGKRAFGDLGKLDSDLRVHLRSRKFPSIAVPAAKVSGGKATVRTLSACQAKIMPVRVRSAVGVNEQTAAKVAQQARTAAAGCENDGFVQRALAETEYDAKNNAAAAAAAERALALDPNNMMALVYRGRVYARAGDWANARKFFVRANRVNPDYALPLVLYHDSFTAAGQTPSKAAQDGLLRALVLVPQDEAVRTRVIVAAIRQGDMATARSALVTLAAAPHAKPDAPAAKILGMIDQNQDKATILAAIDKTNWKDAIAF
ncbi:DUF1570 domain-containing protein [Sphingomonas sp. BN140010]|uniref:DUF1570 domain-containing protein n=1 Tax=Sphingomonas arvum TaxID=2992113 RepID=A0ABT3JIE7_9SPHN|nr:DUF1570 domain-containing protein [Sphingomonas sp. BN140010]MCW3798845.1 DUF1570 domain-containing protein [Sphingomonas sp. BN140010]